MYSFTLFYEMYKMSGVVFYEVNSRRTQRYQSLLQPVI